MQNLKYEFVPGDSITITPGRTVKRIRALAVPGLSPGDLGGYVEAETNLQVYGNAWVYGDARVSGNAWVCGNAQVSGGAWVCGNAQVSGDAWVYGDARVCDDVRVYGNAWVYGDARVYGNAWVYGDARVSGNVWVCGNAQVSGDARVYDNAWVCGNAQVSGGAWVCGNAQVSGDAWVYGDARVSKPNHILMIGPLGSRASMFTVHIDSKIGIRYSTGCFSGSRDEFARAVESNHGDNDHGRAYEAAMFLADLVVTP